MEILITTIISMIMLFAIVSLVCGILMIIGEWCILSKAGEAGWASLIPIYSQYMLCKIAGVNPMWLLIACLSFLANVIPVIGGLLATAAVLYFTILLNVSLARSFGKSDGFAVGLILLPPVFYIMLGCGGAEYVGATPMNDFLFDNATAKSNSNNNGVKYCTSCGAQLASNSNFCPYCGKESK